MVHLDQQLISRAYACIVDRETSHRARELILSYRLAVELHNLHWGRHAIYQHDHERELRAFVDSEEAKQGEPNTPD
jgi:hypothetical protein